MDPTPSPSPNLLSVKELAEHYRIPPPTVYYLIRADKLPVIQISGRYRFDLSEVERVTRRGPRQQLLKLIAGLSEEKAEELLAHMNDN